MLVAMRDVVATKQVFLSLAGRTLKTVTICTWLSGCAFVENIRADGTTQREIVFGVPIAASSMGWEQNAVMGKGDVVRLTGVGLTAEAYPFDSGGSIGSGC